MPSEEIYWRGPRACAWPPRPQRTDVPLIAPEDFRRWILHEDAQLLVVDKPGSVVCHPSKAGPASSLVGAARIHTGLETVHLVFRLDRETSGVIVLAKAAAMAARLQKAVERRRVQKSYLAVLTGELAGPASVDQPLGEDTASPVFIKTAVAEGGRPSRTRFVPLCAAGGFTLARVLPETGRKHQIRAHARWLNHPLVGDKIYGPDERLYLEFIERGWTPELAEKLLLPRQALHCEAIDLRPAGLEFAFRAPLPKDLAEFCARHGLAAATA
ncbi:MAG TPA: RluA family pseudouridine synthase [Opitutaceae bacterium]|nr:RluA family pseudouridine synthase [Opitutaceae bacterium]